MQVWRVRLENVDYSDPLDTDKLYSTQEKAEAARDTLFAQALIEYPNMKWTTNTEGWGYYAYSANDGLNYLSLIVESLDVA